LVQDAARSGCVSQGLCPSAEERIAVNIAINTDNPAQAIKDFLHATVTLISRNNIHVRGSKYSCLDEFILEHGRAFHNVVSFKDYKLRQGIPKECYRNAALVAQRRDDLIYCEGYATSVIPVMHAWLVDKQGNVIDNTWEGGRYDDGKYPRAYFGIPIKRTYLVRSLCNRKIYGVIDNWENEWPILKDDPSLWKEEL
jgi:hypothetical protein